MSTRRQALFENAMRNAAVAKRSYEWGWHIDSERQAAIEQEILAGIEKEDEKLSALLTHPAIPGDFAASFNANSPPQVAKLFYTILEEPIRIRTKTGAPAGGKEALEKLKETAEEPARSIAHVLRQRRILSKLYDAYIVNLRGVDIVRPMAHVTAQVAGRWSYRNPALQTVPPKIKPMFITRVDVRTGERNWMITCDLAGAEYRTMALQSGDEGMMRAFNEGVDLHAMTAQIAFGCTPEQAKEKKFRNPAKSIGLGTHYSVLDTEGAAAGLYSQLIARVPGITMEEVVGIVKRIEEQRPRVFEFKRETLARAEKKDYVEEPLFHRRRYFYGKVKDTEVYNFPQQGMISGIVDTATQGIDAELDHEREGLLLQRYDELVLEGPDPHRLCNLLRKHLRQTHHIDGRSLTFEIDFWIGKRWGDGGAKLEPKDGNWIVESANGKEVFATLTQAIDNATKVA